MHVFLSLQKEPLSFACAINSSDSPLSHISGATLPKKLILTPFHQLIMSTAKKQPGKQASWCPGRTGSAAAGSARPRSRNEPARLSRPYVQVFTAGNGACASRQTAVPRSCAAGTRAAGGTGGSRCDALPAHACPRAPCELGSAGLLTQALCVPKS